MSTRKKKIVANPSKEKQSQEQGKSRIIKGRFVKGQSGNPGGLPKGIKQKGVKIKLAFMEAFDKLGGVQGLVDWANKKNNKTDFYRILANLLPKDIDLGIQDDLLEKYKEFTGNELIKKSQELAESVLGLTGNKRSDKTQEES